jgi:UDP:flavonoid glycosyltransferase YjiC (YdhE family)
MHHLLITIGSHGDTHPFVGLGIRLRERGHRVTLAANGAFRGLVQGAGLEFAELGTVEEFRAALAHPDVWHPLKGFRTVFEQGVLPVMPRTYELVQKYFVPGETIVTAHAIAFGARVAQETLGIPLATVHLAPAVFRSRREPPVFPGTSFMQHAPGWLNLMLFRAVFDVMGDWVLAATVNEFRSKFGLPPASRILHQWWHSPQLVVALFPEWFAAPQPEWPKQTKLTGFPLYDERGQHVMPPEVESFLQRGDPPIAFTFGSAMTQAEEELAASAEACRLLGRRGILLTRHRAQVPPNLPDGVIHVDYAPFSELLPRCAALVHHGGIGTTSQGLAAGVPQLIVPFAHDQHDNAARVKRLGCGEKLSTGAYRPKAIARTLGRLLSEPQVPQNGKSIAAKFVGKDSLGNACELIEELAMEPPAASTRPAPDSSYPHPQSALR